ncbi:polycomb group RING finger protein 1 [Strongylocentrotus purpuratus]|uniref:Polycomb group RING finger protein 1 n=1 Tax=Strongylocentrotus purpuratus TaxID=7668 RepID=A0A7M7NTY4_STRPU|nr:polycomb group RING finger protein 1 [Strongylocentrotus purpuratus]XP_030841690.1 polycomb group RING finger protein 1 [Strongylocentrotus purpuratus]XP_030841691.1 polycomb group RING finger protein 1 [Strongylocentrotus purpuratus]|eukprot:XP_003724093.1 PREDICTED: polycomb group RING finger protein 1 [Strongylocentrotus purpuratus]
MNGEVSDIHDIKLKIRELNQHIVCILCAGYYIDATTVTECLHTFCKSCIVKYLQTSKICPMCNQKVHETQPVLNLRPDRTMQDVVLKLVPKLFEKEEQRKMEFYKSRGLDKVQSKVQQKSFSGKLDPTGGHFYKNDEQVSLCLEYLGNGPSRAEEDAGITQLDKKYIRCSVRTCVYHLQKLLLKKLDVSKDSEVLLYCEDEELYEEEPMKYIWVSHWKGKAAPMVLKYQIISGSSTQNGIH